MNGIPNDGHNLPFGDAVFFAEFTAQEKIIAVKRYSEGTEGHKTIAKSIGASDGVLHAWIQQYHFHRERAFIKRYTTYSVTINSEFFYHLEFESVKQ
ncbi:transposase [Bacillus sp. V2I10]|uniref:transposase n=1 Tax=Bacillus sp. V2I10 TaxID=3042276 RepID=UPI002789F84C|nr:transposase [Bacillus sp. V2I10]MDQ0859449.1 hypothetical protein [Bacillus sp. V2I10]